MVANKEGISVPSGRTSERADYSAHFPKSGASKNKSIMDSFLGEFVRRPETQILVMKRWQGEFCIMWDLKQLIQSSDSAFIMRINSLSGWRVGQI